MALLWNYSLGNITATGQLPAGFAGISGSPAFGSGDGPAGLNTLHTDGKTSWAYAPNVAVPINSHGLVVGCGFTVSTFASQNTGLYSIGGTGGVTALMVLLGSDGSLQLQITDEAPIASASGVFTFGSRHEVEVLVSEFSSGGVVTVELDGVAVAGLTAVATGSLAALNDGANIHTVAIGGASPAGAPTTIVLDSAYVMDTTGSFDNAPVGPAISVPMFPNGVGNASAWTPNGASLGWECIHEVPPDGDTTYISSDTPSQQEACTLSPPASITGVYGLTVFSDQRQDTEGGGRTVELGIGNGSTQVYGSAFGLGTTYAMQSTAFSSNPFASRAWTLADMSTLQVAANVAS